MQWCLFCRDKLLEQIRESLEIILIQDLLCDNALQKIVDVLKALVEDRRKFLMATSGGGIAVLQPGFTIAHTFIK